LGDVDWAMKFLGKLLLTVLLLCVLVIVLGYVVMQTAWAAGLVSRWVSANSDYRLTIGKISHSWSAPSALTLKDVRLARANQPEMLNAGEVSLGLDWQQFSQPGYFDRMTLRNGSLLAEQYSVMQRVLHGEEQIYAPR